MSIRELAPHISCVCTEESLPEALEKYSEVYIITVSGIFKHIKLRYGNRFIRARVTEVPGLKSEITEDLQFLPVEEKIPFKLFQTIVAFFLKVMEVKKSDVEAHIHVLWNPTLGYYLAVPNQRVSKASVSYDYEHIGKDDIIVADFHSHNTMGAFYSGTDNSDDKNKTYYTGVIGELKGQNSFAVKLRFNFNELKRECPVSEIFEVPPEEEIEVPKGWLDRIQTTYAYQGYQGGAVNGYNRQLALAHSGLTEEELMEKYGLGHGYAGKPEDTTGGTSAKKANASGESRVRQKPLQLPQKPGAESSIGMNAETGCIEFPSLNSAIVGENGEAINLAEGSLQIGLEYLDYLTAQYGERTANGFDQILAGLEDLNELDPLLEDLYKEAADRLSIGVKTQFGIPSIILPNSDRIKTVINPTFYEKQYLELVIEYGDDVLASFQQVIEGINDIDKHDEVLQEVVKHTINKMSLQSQMQLGIISAD